jgi:hypothetical protein
MLHAAEQRFTIQVTCACCGVQLVVVLGVQTETVPQDEERIERGVAAGEPAPLGAHSDPIRADEVLDVHLLLRDFAGTLTDLIRQPSGHHS